MSAHARMAHIPEMPNASALFVLACRECIDVFEDAPPEASVDDLNAHGDVFGRHMRLAVDPANYPEN